MATLFGKTAKKAVEIIKSENLTPQEAWKKSIESFSTSESVRNKGCPKSTFLGLCSEGIVRGVTKGCYTRSIMNKIYAITAYKLLRKDPCLAKDKTKLWEIVIEKCNQDIKHSSQMDVVISLWKAGYLI